MVGRQLIGFFRQHRSQAKKGLAEWQKEGLNLASQYFKLSAPCRLETLALQSFFLFLYFSFLFSEEGRLKFPRLRWFNPLNIPFFTFPVNEK